MGAYNQAVEQGLSEEQAIQDADRAVRLTQGTNNASDISRFETGTPMKRLFTQFAGYFNMLANLNSTEILKIQREVGLKKGAGRLFYVYLTGFMLPAVLADVISRIMSGKGFDEDDDDEYLDDALAIYFGSQAKTLTALVPWVGQVASAGYNNFNGNFSDDRLNLSPVISTLESTVGVPAEIYKKLAEDKGNDKRVITDALMLLGLATGLPTGPLAKPARYLMDVESGDANPSNPLDFARGLVTGKKGKDQ